MNRSTFSSRVAVEKIYVKFKVKNNAVATYIKDFSMKATSNCVPPSRNEAYRGILSAVVEIKVLRGDMVAGCAF